MNDGWINFFNKILMESFNKQFEFMSKNMDCGQLNEIQKINEKYELEQACLNQQYIHHNEYDYLYFKNLYSFRK